MTSARARRAAIAAAGAAAILCAAALGSEPALAPAGEGSGAPTALVHWTRALDPGNRGLARGWQRGAFGGAGVSVPNAVDPNQYKGAAGVRNYDGSIAWYRASFPAAAAGLYALSFNSANFKASVWVDGHAAATHLGAYLPFEARVQLAAGTHTVVVRVDWRDPKVQARAGFHRTWFNWGGLNGPVSVSAVGASELFQAFLQTTLSPSGAAAGAASVRVSVNVRNDGPARMIAPEGTLARGGQTVAFAFPATMLQAEQAARVSTAVTVEDPALWSPAHPQLYQLTLRVGQESVISARVGLRELTWHEGRLYLNGRRLRLHGASLQEDALGHGDALTGSDEDTFVRELRAIGANAVRSQHPLDPGLLERLDAAGMLVWQGIGPVEGAGNWYSTTPARLRRAVEQARTAATAAALHPSIIAWNLLDEVAGNGRDGAEVSYVRSLARWLHASDPGRLVAVDVWGDHPPKRAGGLYAEVDAVAETDYTGWYDSPLAAPAQQAAMMRARLAAMRTTFPGRVLVISEFGAEANTLNARGGPGSYAFQSALLARHIDVYRSEPQLSGMLIWDLRDYPLNPVFDGGSIHFKLPRLRLIEGLIQKGLFTYAGTPKPAAQTVARLFRSMPRE